MPLLPATRKLLDEFAKNSVSKMKQNASKYKASGAMRDGFEYKSKEDGIVIYGVDYVEWFEQGRGKTKTKTASEPNLKEKILEWIKIKPIPTWKGYTQQSMAFVIARKIHRQGVSWYNKSPRVIYSDVINDRTLDNLAKLDVPNVQELIISSEITKIFESILTTGFTE